MVASLKKKTNDSWEGLQVRREPEGLVSILPNRSQRRVDRSKKGFWYTYTWWSHLKDATEDLKYLQSPRCCRIHLAECIQDLWRQLKQLKDEELIQFNDKVEQLRSQFQRFDNASSYNGGKKSSSKTNRNSTYVHYDGKSRKVYENKSGDKYIKVDGKIIALSSIRGKYRYKKN